MTIHNTARNTGHNKANIVHNTGRWSKTEEDTFQNAMRLHGVGNWKAISLDVATRQEKGIMTLCTSFTYFLLILYQELINFIDFLLMKNSSAVQCKTHNQKKQIKTETKEGDEKNQSKKIFYNRSHHESCGFSLLPNKCIMIQGRKHIISPMKTQITSE